VDAYREARAVVSLGVAIKTVGWILGAILGCAAVYLYIQSQPHTTASSSLLGVPAWVSFVVGIWAIATVLAFWVIGVLVCAREQHLMASLDSAVNSSPFLSNEQRARAMSLD
jgi:hypothetical protein